MTGQRIRDQKYPRVSIGMPFFNAGRFMREAIESVLAQTYANWELLLVDDGSTDSSPQLALEYAARHAGRIRYLQHADLGNHGISASRNLALCYATGDYVGFLDADDVWLANKLSRQIEILQSNPGAEMVYGVYECWYGWTGSSEDRKRDFLQDLGVQSGVIFPPPTLLTLLYPLGQTATPSMSDFLVSRAAIDRVGGFEKEFRGLYEDHAFLVKLYLNASIIASGECWDKYRMHPDSCVSTVKKEGRYQDARAYFFKWFEAYLRARGIDDAVIWAAYRNALCTRRTMEDHYGGWLFRVTPGNEAQLVVPERSTSTLRVLIDKCETPEPWDIQLNRPKLSVQSGCPYKVAFRARADQPRILRVGVALAHSPWTNLGCYQSIAVSEIWQSFELDFIAKADEDNARIHFDLGQSNISVEISTASLRRPDGSVAQAAEFGGFGDLRRVTPISRNWGYDRGQPVDRYYIQKFLARHCGDIRGRVLEIRDDGYTRQFGGTRVEQCDVLDVTPENPDATLIADLADAPQLPSELYDCIILTQTLQYIPDVRAAIQTVYRLLKPGGVLLATLPGITQTEDAAGGASYWSFTPLSGLRLFQEAFPNEDVQIERFGNVLVAISFLHGLSAEDLTPEEMDYCDRGYEVLIALRAVKTDSARYEMSATGNSVLYKPADGKALILMYHRLCGATADPFSLSVTPEHFAEHLEVVRRCATPMRLQDLTRAIEDRKLPPNAVVITFDDGYADNLHNARPILARYDIPATVFIISGVVDQEREFWWDELERLLEPGTLPNTLILTRGGDQLRWELDGAAQYDSEDCRRHGRWRAEEEAPPTPRQALYSSMWNLIHLMPEADRQTVLDHIAGWSGRHTKSRPEYRSLMRHELIALGQGELIEIGAHSATHPPLGRLLAEEQRREIARSRAQLEEILGRTVTSFSYPHGSLSDDTAAIVRECGFERACCSIRSLAGRDTDRYLLPRVQVEDWEGDRFAAWLAGWLER